MSSQRDGGSSNGSERTTVEAHLTVAAVAARLGVAASTLRTWDRRYGLGPSGRAAGSHRRYSQEDLARLETMRALTERGVALADAARMAQQSAPVPEALVEDLDALSLAAAAIDSGHERLVTVLRASVGRRGLLETYLTRVEPAFGILAESERSDVPGHEPEVAVTAAMLEIIRDQAVLAPKGEGGEVLVVGEGRFPLSAHVLAGALGEHGVRARVSRPHREGVSTHHGCDRAALAIELHIVGDTAVEVDRSTCEHELMMVGSHADAAVVAHRVRTLSAALPEALDVLATSGQRASETEEPAEGRVPEVVGESTQATAGR